MRTTLFGKHLKNTIIDTLELYKDHYIRYIFGILLIIIISSFFVMVSNNGLPVGQTYCLNDNGEQYIYILGITLSNWLTYISIISIVGTACFALFQFDKQNKLSQEEKAAEIMRRFSKEIVEKLAIINSVILENKQIEKWLKEEDKINRETFDYEELVENVKNEERIIRLYKMHINNANDIYIQKLSYVVSENELNGYPKDFFVFLQKTLNELEAICMDISSNVAGSQFIYPSLHQIFLPTIRNLYVYICDLNRKDNTYINKYYLNIIYVYNYWSLIEKRDIMIEKRIRKRISKDRKQIPKRV